MFARLGAAMVRARWAVIGVWAAIALVGAIVGGSVFDRAVDVPGTSPDAESIVAKNRIDELKPEGPTILAALLGYGPYDQRIVQNATKIDDQIRALPGVVKVDDVYSGHGQIGADNNSSLVRVELADHLPEPQLEATEDQVVALLHRIEAPRVLVTGDHLARRAFADQATKDAVVGESIALVVLLFVLVVVFRGLSGASVPLAVAGVVITTGLLGLLGLSAVTSVSQFAVNIVTLFGIGLAVDYSLLLLFRFREARAAEPDAPAADWIGRATATAGRAVVYSGLAVAAAMVGLYAMGEPLLSAMALGGVVVVAVATAVALTLVPALLAVFGDRIPAPGATTWVTRAGAALRARLLVPAGRWWTARVHRDGAKARPVAPRPRSAGATSKATTKATAKATSKATVKATAKATSKATVKATAKAPSMATATATARAATGGLLGRCAGYAQRRPGPVAAVCTVGLLGLAALFFAANLGDSDARAMPTSMEVRQGYDAVQAEFNNHHAVPVTVLAEVAPDSPDVRLFMNRLGRLSQVERLEVRPDVPNTATVIDLTPRGATSGPESRALVREVRAIDTPFRVRVGGSAAELVDSENSVAGRLPVVMLVLLVATGILLFLLTGSVVVPIKALLLNVLTLGATLGVLVVVFQWGWGSALLGFDSWGALDLTTPLLVFVFVFGLTMDYEVFLLARITEEWRRTRDNDRAVLAGIRATGPVVTSAALCIGVVFLGFVLGRLTAVKEVGFGMAVAILLDVTVVRGLLLPAVMTMLGDLNWWAPRFLRRRRQPGPSDETRKLVTIG